MGVATLQNYTLSCYVGANGIRRSKGQSSINGSTQRVSVVR